MLHRHGHNPLIAIWVFGNLSALITGCHVPRNHVTTFCNLLCQLPQKNQRGSQREGCKLLPPPAKRTHSHFWGLAKIATCLGKL